MSRSQRAYVQNNYLYRFPVDYSDLLATRASEDDKFNGSNSSGSLLLRHDAVYDSDFDFIQQRLIQKPIPKLVKSKRKRKKKSCKYFNHLFLCLLFSLSLIGVFFYFSMWLVKHNSSKCEVLQFEESTTSNSTNFHWVIILFKAFYQITRLLKKF